MSRRTLGSIQHPAAVASAVGTKEFIITVSITTGTGAFVGAFPTVSLSATAQVGFGFFVPNDFTTLTSAVVLVIPDATETIQYDITTDYGASGESRTANSESSLNDTLAVTADLLTELDVSGVLTGIAANDYVGFNFVSDTTVIRVLLLRIRYT